MKYANWILVPIDFSEDSRLALKAADGQAHRWGSGLILLHVKKPTEHPRTRMTIEEEVIRRWARWVEQTPRHRVSFMTCYGDPAEEILKIAEQYKPRKIIMGRGGDAWRAGSVTEAVGQHFQGLVEAISAVRDDVYLHAQVAGSNA
jgi:nucleotide-binding universal stress UspA family protein